MLASSPGISGGIAMKTKWKMLPAALYGALAGIIVSVVGPMLTGGTMPSDPTELFGNLLGGGLVGVIAGIIVAVVRNSQVKAG